MIISNLPTDVTTLHSMLIAAYTDRAYGCLTRAGITALHTYTPGMSVVFLDIDGMHDLNTLYSYAGVDARIKNSIECRGENTVAARWQSGDEIMFVLPSEDAHGLVTRLTNAFAVNGMSAMYGVAALGHDLEASVTIASSLVQAQKAARAAQV